MDIGNLMHELAWNNPFYDVFYSTADLAITVATILFVALGIALYRRNKRASIGLGAALLVAATAGTVLKISHVQIMDTYAYINQTYEFDTRVTGVRFIGFPILVGLAAVALLGLFGKTLWSSKHAAATKLLQADTFLLGASLFGTFAAQLAQDMFQVGSIYEGRWSTVGTYFWLADFVLTCALGLVALYAGGRYLHQRVGVETLDTDSPYWRRLRLTDKKTLRTADAPATA